MKSSGAMRSLQNRSGTVLICVLACLLVSTTTVACGVQLALRQRREFRLEHQMRQTEWLLDAGVMRAKRSIETPSYGGEIWRPSPTIGHFGDAVVEIKFMPCADGSDTRVVVMASIGQPNSSARTQRTYSFQCLKRDASSSNVEKT